MRILFILSLLIAFSFCSHIPLHGIPTNQFAVKLQDGIDPSEIASTHKLIFHGKVGVLPNWYLFDAPATSLLPRVLEHLMESLRKDERIIDFDRQIIRPTSLRQNIKFNDPLFPSQWNLNNNGQGGGVSGNDINVYPVWNNQVSGKSVLFQVIDNGLETSNIEFAHFVSAASYNLVTNNKDPNPLSNLSYHGTAVAGIAVAQGNNKNCGVGVAYSASISAINYVDGNNVTDFNTARALTEWSLTTGVDVSINSWGYPDAGNIITRTGTSIANIIEESRQVATTQGRHGKGLVIVWATGDGHTDGGNCNYDMLTQSPYIITVAASNAQGVWSGYSDYCAANFVNAPSNDLPISSLPSIVTPITGRSCTSQFGGTSAAAPTVAGVVGLMLDVNANLTYRDVMHIIVKTAYQNDPTDNTWYRNFAGVQHSYKYGFGRINAASAVSLARNWTNVAPLSVFRTFKDFAYIPILSNSATYTRSVQADFSGSVEHVNLYVNIDHKYPNELTIVLVSPSGTVNVMAPSFNPGPHPVIYNNGTYYSSNYATFSFIIPPQGINYQSIIPITVDDECNISPELLSGSIAFYIYDSSCDSGDIALQVEAQGGLALLITSPSYQYVSGSSGASIPVLRITAQLAKVITLGNAGSGKLFHGKTPIYGDYRNNYRMMTVRNWGENPYGRWELKITDNTPGDNGLLEDWYLEFFGDLQKVSEPITQIVFNSGSLIQPTWIVILLTIFGFWLFA